MSFSPRRLLADIGVYGIGDIVMKSAALITLPIYTRVFTPAEYGIWSFVVNAVAVFGGILALGGDSAYARYFFASTNRVWRQLVTSTWLAFLAGWSLAATVVALVLAEPASEWAFDTSRYAILFSIVLISTPLTLINTMCGQVLRNQFRPQLYTVLSVATTVLTVGISVFAVLALGAGLVGVVIGPLAAAVLMLPIRIWTVRDMLRPMFSVRMLRRLLSYGLPLVPMTLAYWIFSSSDRIVLGKLSTVEQLGLYSVAASATSALALFHGAFGQAWSPHMVQAYERDRAGAARLFGRVMTYLLAGFGLLAVAATAFAPELLTILATPPFRAAAMAVGPLALGYMAYASTQITASGISLTKRTRYFAIFSWLAAGLNLGLNLLFVPRWGMMAAAWATAASYGFLTLSYLLVSQRLWPVIYERRRAAAVLTLTLAFTIGAMLLPPMPLAWGIVAKVAYCGIYAGMLLLASVVRLDELRALRRAEDPPPAVREVVEATRA